MIGYLGESRQVLGKAKYPSVAFYGARVGGQIEIEVIAAGADEEIPDGATDEVQTVSCGIETVGERPELVQHRGEAVGDHGAPRLGDRSRFRWIVAAHGRVALRFAPACDFGAVGLPSNV